MSTPFPMQEVQIIRANLAIAEKRWRTLAVEWMTMLNTKNTTRKHRHPQDAAAESPQSYDHYNDNDNATVDHNHLGRQQRTATSEPPMHIVIFHVANVRYKKIIKSGRPRVGPACCR